jgi:outer membrane protein assembly factor BamB
MSRWGLSRVVLVGFLILESTFTVRGADWPQWGGSNARNMASDEKDLPAIFEPGKKQSDGSGIDLRTTCNVRWVARLGTENYSSPVVADGKVFIGTNDACMTDPRYRPTGGGLLLCLDEATGKPLWQLPVPKLREGRRSSDYDEMNLGICSTPTVEGNRVYVVTNRCDVLCLDAEGMTNGNDGPFVDERDYTVEPGERPVEPKRGDADIIWQYDMLNRLPVFPHDAANCSPLVYGDYVYVCTANGTDDGKPAMPLAPSLIALDKHTGRLVAREDEMISSRVFHGQWSSPSLGLVHDRPEVFFGAGDGVCYAFDAITSAASRAGYLRHIWSFDCNTPEHKFRDGKPIDYWEGDKRKDLGNHDDGTYLGLNEIIGTPVFYNNRVYVAVGRDPLHGLRTKGGLFCIDATRTGEISKSGTVWSFEDIGRTLSTVSIADGLLYVADEAGRVYCMEADTGKLCWMHQTWSDIWSSTLVADGKVYIGTRRHFCVLAAGRQKRLLAEVRLGSQVRSTPAVADGVLYVASQRYLWAVQLTKPHGLVSSPIPRRHADHKSHT